MNRTFLFCPIDKSCVFSCEAWSFMQTSVKIFLKIPNWIYSKGVPPGGYYLKISLKHFWIFAPQNRIILIWFKEQDLIYRLDPDNLI